MGRTMRHSSHRPCATNITPRGDEPACRSSVKPPENREMTTRRSQKFFGFCAVGEPVAWRRVRRIIPSPTKLVCKVERGDDGKAIVPLGCSLRECRFRVRAELSNALGGPSFDDLCQRRNGWSQVLDNGLDCHLEGDTEHHNRRAEERAFEARGPCTCWPGERGWCRGAPRNVQRRVRRNRGAVDGRQSPRRIRGRQRLRDTRLGRDGRGSH